MPTGDLADALTARGYLPGRCRWCGVTYAVDLDHAGKALPNLSRRYCTRQHKAAAARHRTSAGTTTPRPPSTHGQMPGQLTIPEETTS